MRSARVKLIPKSVRKTLWLSTETLRRTGERDRVEQAKQNLRRERNERLELIEEGDISREKGEELAGSIIGIDRALNALESLGPTNLEREQKAQQAADTKRWMSFLKKALGQDDDAATRRGR